MAANEFNPLIPCVCVRNAQRRDFRTAVWNNMKRDKNRDGSDAGTRGGGWMQIPVDEAKKEESIQKFTADIKASVSAVPIVKTSEKKKEEVVTVADTKANDDPNDLGTPAEEKQPEAETNQPEAAATDQASVATEKKKRTPAKRKK